jgi:hypothetical protein
MRVVFGAATMALLVVASPVGIAAPRTNCQPQALHDLQRLSPRGYAVYLAMKDKQQFLAFLTCDDVQLGLSTAVHESVHILTEQYDAYPLIAGGSVPRLHEISRFYPPREIAAAFNRNDNYVQTYLRRGAASSADDLSYLLDELNAYSHDLASATKLISIHREDDGQVDHRAGLAALMSFVMRYAKTAREEKHATWEGLQRAEVKALVRTLWMQAESVLTTSWGIPGFGGEKYVEGLCNKRNGDALAELIAGDTMSPQVCAAVATASSGESLTK